jgi:hypothetical protein
MSPELVAPTNKFTRKVLKIIYFAVVNHDDRVIFVEQRLSATGKIDDGKSPVTQTDPAVYKDTVAIGTPMVLKIVHTRKQGRVNGLSRPAIEYSNYSTHVDPEC